MITQLLILITLLLGIALLACLPSLARRVQRRGLTRAVNFHVGSREKSYTAKASAALASRFLLVRPTANPFEIALNGVADMPVGVCDDECDAAGDLVNVNILGLVDRTITMVASEAIGLDDEVYTAANGRVQDLPTGAGTYWKVGRPLTIAAANGDKIEVIPCYPVRLVIP